MKKKYVKTIVSTLIVGSFLFLAFGSDETSDNNSSTNNNSEKKEKNCAVISAPSRPGSVRVRLCKEDYSSESEWKADINKIKKAKSEDWQLGKTYSVYVDYE